MSIKPTSISPKNLYQSITSSGMSFKLNNIKGWDGNDLTASDFGTQAFGAFLSSDRTLLELFEWDPSTIANSSITILYRGLKFDGTQTTEVAVNKLNWTANETIVMLGSDVPQFLSLLQALGMPLSYLDTDTTLAANSDTKVSSQKAIKTYIANVITGIIGVATNLLYGTVKMTTSTSDIAVATDDPRFTTESGTAINATTNKIIDEASVGITGNDKVVRLTAGGKLTTSVIDTGVTDGQIIKATTGNKLPAIDGSNLTNTITPVPEQDIAYDTVGTVIFASGARMSASLDGSVMSITYSDAIVNFFVKKLVRDILTQQYYVTHTATFNTGGAIVNDVSSMVIGNYIYVIYLNNATPQIVRYDKADLANPQAITISGTSPGGNLRSVFTDGTNMYIFSNSDGRYYKYTISGTTATYDSSITYNSGGANPAGIISDGVHVWIIDPAGTGATNIKKYDFVGGASLSTTSLIIYGDAYPNSSLLYLCIPKTGILGIGFGHTLEANNGVTGAALKLSAITLP